MYDGDAIQKQKEAYLEKYYQWLQIKQKLADSKNKIHKKWLND